MSEDTKPRRIGRDSDGDFSGTWFVAHFLVLLALIDAFLFRNLLIPELLASEAAITGQVQMLSLWAFTVTAPLLLIYAMTKRTARARARLYHLGAWIFFGVTIYFLVEDYEQYAEPGRFTIRINIAIGRIETFIGFDLPRL